MNILYFCPDSKSCSDLANLKGLTDESDAIVVLSSNDAPLLKNVPTGVPTFLLSVEAQIQKTMTDPRNQEISVLSFASLVKLTHHYEKIVTWYL